MGFDVTQLTQDEKQSFCTIKTDMPIPLLVYEVSFQWAKCAHHILLSSLDLTSHNKASLHQTFWNSLIEFLRTDLDGNLSSSLNPLTASKLDYHLSRLLEGLLGTANKGDFFDQHMLNAKSKHKFIEDIGNIALFATRIPLSIFTNLSHQRFEKHSMLESMLEILQQLHIQMETQPLRCIRCGQSVTLPGSIGEILLHAPTAMLYHWNIIQSHDEENHRESMLMPLLFTS
jgi:hypothetical protein